MSDLDRLADAINEKQSASALNYSSGRRSPKAKGLPIICPNPNCGYRGASIRKAKGSVVTLILLFLIGVLPGVLYLVFWHGYIYVCPRCGMKARN